MLCVSAAAEVQELALSGTDGDGYLALAGLNQEGNTALNGLNRNPGNAKFFDYPAYVNPNIPSNVYVMSVEPYRFGLSFPDPLHPTGPGVFADVGDLQPAGTPGATFIEALTEDADFADFDLGVLSYDDATLTGQGIETVGVDAISLDLDGTEFQSTNRTELLAGADAPPFGPEGRSNRNEFANTVSLEASNFSGTGLTFTDGVLTSIDFTADAAVEVALAALPTVPLRAEGTLTFAENTFAFDIDGQDSLLTAVTNVRLILNRSGSLQLGVSTTLPGDYNASGAVEQGDLNLVLNNWGQATAPGWIALEQLEGAVDQAELNAVLNNWGARDTPALSESQTIPEPATFALLLGSLGLRRVPRAGR
ncbi:MAG: hypothetical protein AAGE65_11950 [Planctomycetota bacterium]